MAEETVKKTAPRKRAAAKPKTSPKAEVESTKPVIEKDEYIPCRNVFAGETIMVGKKNGGLYSWNGVGDVAEVLYEDLRMEIVNRNSTYIYSPLILVDDERVLELFPKLAEFYSGLEAPENFESLLLNGSLDELRGFIESQPKGMRSALRSVASDLVMSGELDSHRKIKLIDEVLGTKLMMLAD